MKYQQGSFGRVFLLRFDDGDDLLKEIKTLATRENVKVGTIMLLGGIRSAEMVIGPKEAVIPPDPLWMNFNDAREVLGFGTLFWKDDDPMIHLHGAVGRGTETFTGCIRKGSSVYLVVEAIITELVGISARRVMNEKAGLAMLEL
jgi:predicted DNA-binding protein with PD1-like motif